VQQAEGTGRRHAVQRPAFQLVQPARVTPGQSKHADQLALANQGHGDRRTQAQLEKLARAGEGG